MDETQEKSVIKSDRKEKIGNTITQLNLLHTPFIDHGDYGGSSPAPCIRDDLLAAWRGWKTHHRASRQSSCRRSDYNTYPPLGLRIVEVGGRRL
jgi:hypothetical protein